MPDVDAKPSQLPASLLLLRLTTTDSYRVLVMWSMCMEHKWHWWTHKHMMDAIRVGIIDPSAMLGLEVVTQFILLFYLFKVLRFLSLLVVVGRYIIWVYIFSHSVINTVSGYQT